MNLCKRLGIIESGYRLIAIAGGGGKTTTMNRLARELAEEGQKVLVTTTTAMMMPESGEYDYFVTEEEFREDGSILEYSAEPGKVTVLIGSIVRIDKVKGIEMPLVDQIKEMKLFDHILVETDGAKRKPIKAPREDEPLNPYSTDLVIGVIGLDSLGRKIEEENIHRVEIFKKILKLEDEKYVDEKIVSDLVLHPQGLFKNAAGKDRILILNKADDMSLRERGEKIRKILEEKNAPLKDVLVMSLLRE